MDNEALRYTLYCAITCRGGPPWPPLVVYCCPGWKEGWPQSVAPTSVMMNFADSLRDV